MNEPMITLRRDRDGTPLRRFATDETRAALEAPLVQRSAAMGVGSRIVAPR